jgi:hypothetical protein
MAFSNVFVLVPFVRLLDNGIPKVFPKLPFFIVHTKLPATADRPLFQYLSGKSGISYNPVGGEFLYNVAQINASGGNHKHWLQIFPGDNQITGTFRYSSKFPFILRLALHSGKTDAASLVDWSKRIKKTDLTSEQLIYYEQYFPHTIVNNALTVKDATIRPFANLSEMVRWFAEANQKSAALVAYVEPFHMYRMGEFVDDRGFSPGQRTSNEKIASFLMGSRNPGAYTGLDKAVATFVNTATQRYTAGEPTESGQQPPEILIVYCDPTDFHV